MGIRGILRGAVARYEPTCKARGRRIGRMGSKCVGARGETEHGTAGDGKSGGEVLELCKMCPVSLIWSGILDTPVAQYGLIRIYSMC